MTTSLHADKDACGRVVDVLGLALKTLREMPNEVGGIPESDTPPCRICGGKLTIKENPKQGRWYAFCTAELRSHGYGETAQEALKAHFEQ